MAPKVKPNIKKPKPAKRDFKHPPPERRTPRYHHEPIPMVLRARPSEFKSAGDYCIRAVDGDKKVFVIAIPTNQEGKWFPCEWTINHRNESGAQWSWNQNEHKPTLTPSLHWVGVWHGWVKDGMLIEA